MAQKFCIRDSEPPGPFQQEKDATEPVLHADSLKRPRTRTLGTPRQCS